MPHNCQGRIYRMSLPCFYQGKNAPYVTPCFPVCGGGEEGLLSVGEKKSQFVSGLVLVWDKTAGLMDVILVKITIIY